MIIQFSEYLPDQPRLGNRCITATNVRPTENGYGPFAAPVVYTEALPAKCIGRISFRRVGGVRETFAGTETKLYRLNGTEWDEVTQTSGDYTTSVQWRFALYGERLVATNGIDDPQRFDLDTDTAFSTLTNAPKHKFPLVVRDVLVALDLQDGSGNEVGFSAVNNSENWTLAAGGGAQSFADGGPVVGGTGGEYGVILQEFAITRMDFVGGDLRFTFDKIEGALGCVDSASIVSHKGDTYYYSEEGFQVFNGAQSQDISSGKIPIDFLVTLDQTRVTDVPDTRVTSAVDTRIAKQVNVIQGALDPENSSVVWTFNNGTANELLIYSYRLGRWSTSDADITQLHTAVRSAGLTLAGFDSSNRLVHFNGANLTAVLSTGDLQLSRDRGSFVTSARGLVDSAHDVTVAKKTDLADTEITVTASSNANGKCSLRSHGRYHRIQISPTAAFTEITGVDVELRQSGSKV